MSEKVVIFGGSGFLGRYVVKKIVEAGYRVEVFTRDVESAGHLKVCGNVGQVRVITGSLFDDDFLADLLRGTAAVINLIGILYEKYDGEFQHVHVDMAERIAIYAAEQKVEKLIHVSALVSGDGSKYVASKKEGENVVLKYFPSAVIIRPSLIFGKEDDFFNKFAQLTKFLPILPLIGGGHMSFQPVYVCDVAMLITSIVSNKITNVRQFYNIGGPKIYSFKALMKFILNVTNRRCLLIHIPFFMAKALAAVLSTKVVTFLLKPISGNSEPLITIDQVKIMQNAKPQKKFSDLEKAGIRGTYLENVAPKYLRIYKRKVL